MKMKKNINKFLCGCLIVLTTACSDTDNDVEIIVPDAFVELVTTQISVFDTNTPISLNIIEDGSEVTSVQIMREQTVLGEASLSDTNATFNSSIFSSVTTDSNKLPVGGLNFGIKYQTSTGVEGLNSETINVVKAIRLTNEVPSYQIQDTTTSSIIYETFSEGATLEDLNVSFRIGNEGDSTEISDDFDVENGEIDLSEGDYLDYGVEVNDTLYYTFTVTSGSLSDSVETFVVFNAQNFSINNTVTLSSQENQNFIDLDSGEVLTMARETENEGEEDEVIKIAEITFAGPAGFEKTSDVDISFAKLSVSEESSEEFFSGYNDVMQARTDFNNLSAQTSVQVSNGEIYVYKIERDIMDNSGTTATEEVYGIIRIGDIVVTNNNPTTVIINYKQGTILE